MANNASISGSFDGHLEQCQFHGNVCSHWEMAMRDGAGISNSFCYAIPSNRINILVLEQSRAQAGGLRPGEFPLQVTAR